MLGKTRRVGPMADGIDGLFTGTVEADETYVGGKFDKRR